MVSTQAFIGREHYATHITGSNAAITSDEPEERGGQGKGMSPGELLAASLASCTCITLRMYADRKAWPLERVDVTIQLETDHTMNITDISMDILFTGVLDEMQKKRLLEIGSRCPVHKLLNNPIRIKTNSL